LRTQEQVRFDGRRAGRSKICQDRVANTLWQWQTIRSTRLALDLQMAGSPIDIVETHIPNISCSQAKSGKQENDRLIPNFHRPTCRAGCNDPLDRCRVDVARQCRKPVSPYGRHCVQQRWAALASANKKPKIAPHDRGEQRSRSRDLLAATLERISQSGSIPLCRRAEHGHQPLNLCPVSPDRLVGHASILPEPTDICRDLRIFDHLHRDRSDGAPITKKLNEVPCATPPSLPAGSGQLAALAENRAPTIVIGILFGDRVIDIGPWTSRYPQPGREVLRL